MPICHWDIVVCVCMYEITSQVLFFFIGLSFSLFFFFACSSLRNSLRNLVRTFGDVS